MAPPCPTAADSRRLDDSGNFSRENKRSRLSPPLVSKHDGTVAEVTAPRCLGLELEASMNPRIAVSCQSGDKKEAR